MRPLDVGDRGGNGWGIPAGPIERIVAILLDALARQAEAKWGAREARPLIRWSGSLGFWPGVEPPRPLVGRLPARAGSCPNRAAARRIRAAGTPRVATPSRRAR